jgi:hypothetical protein
LMHPLPNRCSKLLVGVLLGPSHQYTTTMRPPYRATLSSILPWRDGPAVVSATDAGVGVQQVSQRRRLGGGGAKPIRCPPRGAGLRATDRRSICGCELPGSGSHALLISLEGRWPQPALQLGWPQQNSCAVWKRRLAGTMLT